MLWKEFHDNQLFIFWNGQLIFKKWYGDLYNGHNAVMDLHGTWFFWDTN